MRLTRREIELFDRRREIEEAAGVLLFIGGKCDWEKYEQSQNDLAAVNPEYKSLLDEMAVISAKSYARKEAQHKRVIDLRVDLQSIIHNNDSLNDEQKVALRVAVELMWGCKDGVVVRAEKRAKKEAAKNVPDFHPAAWHKKKPSKAANSQESKNVNNGSAALNGAACNTHRR